MYRQIYSLIGASTILWAGCGPTGPAMYDVHGTVTWNGAPLAKGDIILEAPDGSTLPSADKVINGEFKFKATPGKKLVRIFATRETGKFDPQMGTKVLEQFLPERYNHETKLNADIVSGPENRLTFALTD